METLLCDRKCVPCQGGVPPLKGEALQSLMAELGGDWSLVDEHHLERTYAFDSFRSALDFTNQVGELAEEEGHHPVILLNFRKVTITLWTHKIDGVVEADFVMAAKIDREYGGG